MEDTKPYPLTSAEWQEVMAIPAIRESWGIEDDSILSDFSSRVYAAKFKFVSGGPGYVGDLYILQGDGGEAPIVLHRDGRGKLILI
jgi:hypothetical protein